MSELDTPFRAVPNEELTPGQLHAQVKLMVTRLPYNIPEVKASIPANFFQERELTVSTDHGLETITSLNRPVSPEDMRGDLAEDVQVEMVRSDIEMTLSEYYTRRARGFRGRGERGLTKEEFREKFAKYFPLSRLTTSCLRRLEANIDRAYETGEDGKLLYAEEEQAIWGVIATNNIFLSEDAMLAEQEVYDLSFDQLGPEEDQRWKADYLGAFRMPLNRLTGDPSANQ